MKRNAGWFKKGHKTSALAIDRARQKTLGSGNIHWKGDNASYYAKHIWLKTNYGKADHCENEECSYTPPVSAKRRFSWANISGKYRRDIKDYVQLCYSCHKKWDLGLLEIRIKTCE